MTRPNRPSWPNRDQPAATRAGGAGLLTPGRSPVEELSDADVRDQMETNFFGALWVTQAALPIMRRQGSGHILQVTVAAFK